MVTLPKVRGFRSYLTTSIGVGAAQFIALLSIPFIAKISGPDVFGTFSYYYSIVLVLCVFTSLKLEFSVFTIPWRLYPYLKILVFWLFPLMSAVLAIIAGAFLWYLERVESVFFLVCSITSLLLGICSFEFVIQDNIKKGQFKQNAYLRIQRAILLPVIFIALYYIYQSSSEIILLSFAFSNIVGVILCNKKICTHPRLIIKKIMIIRLFESCKRVMFYLVPAHFLNRYSTGSFILLGGLMGVHAESLAKYALVEKLMLAPAAIVTSAISDVVKSEIMRNPSAGLNNFYRLSFYSCGLAVISCFIIVFASEGLISLLMGDKWAGSSSFAIALLPYFVAVLVLSPITHVYTVLNKQNYDFFWQIVHASLISVSIIIGMQYSIELSVWFYSITASISIFGSAIMCIYLVNHVDEKKRVKEC